MRIFGESGEIVLEVGRERQDWECKEFLDLLFHFSDLGLVVRTDAALSIKIECGP